MENDEQYISMVDDVTDRSVNIPVAFLLGKSGYKIKSTIHKLDLDQVLINIPINITSLKINKINQPPWLVW